MIERTFDYRIIKRIMGKDKYPVISSKLIYLLDEKIGVWTCDKYLDGIMMHIDILKEARGKKALDATKKAFQWLFDKGYKIIYAGIPEERKHVCNFALSAGMEFTHIKSGGFCNNKQKYRMYKINSGG